MSYMSNADYLERFGAAETIRATDETKAGAVDQGKVEKAIVDASAEADSYLAVRYALPIPTPTPEIVAGIVADLARERINRARPTDIIIANATRARSQLRDLSAGRASIPANAPGQEVPENPSGLPTSSHDARPRVFTDASLGDFLDFGYSPSRTVFDGPRGW